MHCGRHREKGNTHQFQQVQRHKNVVAAHKVTEHQPMVCPHDPNHDEAERECDVARPLVKQQPMKAADGRR
jgi:hypothetical protein